MCVCGGGCIGKMILRFLWKYKRPRVVKAIFKMKKKVTRLASLDTKKYQAIVIKTMLFWYKDK